MLPVLLELGPITIYSFGLMLAAAFLVSGHLYAGELARRGLDPDLSSTAVTWGVIGGVVGARLYYVIEHWDEVRLDLVSSVLSGAGLVAYGGFAGGIAACWLALRRRRAPVLRAVDAAAPFLALGYAIGRIGCLLAGDGDYGPPSDLPWAMAFPRGIVPTTVPVHPTPLYETLMMTGVFVLLWRWRLEAWPPGKLFAAYLALAGLERLLAEHWRLTPAVALGLTVAQWISLAAIALAVAWLWRLRREPASPVAGEAGVERPA
jgi:phosphatidylglycerol:prolipoprotein diacylglycerol transferase